jgi:hypothetical protein
LYGKVMFVDTASADRMADGGMLRGFLLCSVLSDRRTSGVRDSSCSMKEGAIAQQDARYVIQWKLVKGKELESVIRTAVSLKGPAHESQKSLP